MTKPLKIGFVLCSNRRAPEPSTRISVLNMLPSLGAAGYEPSIAFEPPVGCEQPDISGLGDRMLAQEIDIAYFQKVRGPSVLAEIRKLTAAGVKTIYGVCDYVENDIAEAATATIVATDILRRQYRADLREKIHVVHDGIENPDIYKEYPPRDTLAQRSSDRLRAVLVSSSELDEVPEIDPLPSFVDLTVVGRYPMANTLPSAVRRTWAKLRSRPTHLTSVQWLTRQVRPGFRRINWGIEAVYRALLQADVGVIPVDMKFDPLPGHNISWWQIKSENRLTLKMAAALPVVASPVPSYEAVINHGTDGYLARSRRDWLDCLESLRDPSLRCKIGTAARAAVLAKFSKEEQARKLLEVLRKLAAADCKN